MERESRAVRLHILAVDHYRVSSSHRWVACLAAKRIVGKYIPGATLALAADLRISPEQVKALARAGDTYCEMRKHCKELPEYRKALSPSHFSEMGLMMRRYDIPMREAIEQIKTAAEEGISVDKMRKYVAEEYRTLSTEWIDHLGLVVRHIKQILTGQAPEDVVDACEEFILDVEDYLP